MYSTGPNYITVYVPFGLAGEAAAALQAAEMDGDVTGLNALTEKLTLPLDDWLAPGERALVQGATSRAGPLGSSSSSARPPATSASAASRASTPGCAPR
jgi:hypothetical protein